MSGEVVVTLEQIRDLIKTEGLSPEDVFTSDFMRRWHEGRTYAEKVAQDEKAQDKGGDAQAEGGASKYLDPKQNPFIKTGE